MLDKDCWLGYYVVAIAVATCTYTIGEELERTLVIYAKGTTMMADNTALVSVVQLSTAQLSGLRLLPPMSGPGDGFIRK